MKKLAIIFATTLIAGIFLFFKQSENKVPTGPSVTIRSHTFAVEIAKTNEQRQKGLSFRSTLEKNHGMLFVFETAQMETFWMYGMEFSLDIIFIRGDKIVTIYENVPNSSADTLPSELPRYVSKQPVNYVLEISSGLSGEYGFKEGDSVRIEGVDQ